VSPRCSGSRSSRPTRPLHRTPTAALPCSRLSLHRVAVGAGERQAVRWVVSSSMIQVRFHSPNFAPSDVRAYLRRSGRVDQPLAWPEFAVRARGKGRKRSFEDAAYLMGVLAPEFAFRPDGLFLHGMPPHVLVDPSYVREHGRFDSEGINNHVHLQTFTRSRIAQFEIGIRVASQWIRTMEAMKSRPDRAVIYLTGQRDFDVCIYSDPTPEEMDTLERRLGGEIHVKTADVFLEWAFQSPPNYAAAVDAAPQTSAVRAAR
jgi:hypothetical protein